MPSLDSFKNREEYNKYYREYRKKNIVKLRNYNRKYNCKYRKEHGYINEQNSNERYPIKDKARRKLWRAVKAGKIKRKPCEVCGKRKLIHGHHDDYSKPLEVRWLCPLHHTEVHINMAKK